MYKPTRLAVTVPSMNELLIVPFLTCLILTFPMATISATATAQGLLGELLRRPTAPASNAVPAPQPQQSQPTQTQDSEPVPGSEDVAGPPNSLVAIVADYGADGKLQQSHATHNLARQQDCNSYVNQQIKEITSDAQGRDIVSNNSLVILPQNTGYTWLGCISEADFASPAYRKFVQTPITKKRIYEMTRYPVLNQQEPAGSQRGKQIRM